MKWGMGKKENIWEENYLSAERRRKKEKEENLLGLAQKILYLVSKEEDEGGYGKERKYLRRKIFGQQREEERRKRRKIYYVWPKKKYYFWSLKKKKKKMGDMEEKENIWKEKYLVSREKKKEGKGWKSIGDKRERKYLNDMRDKTRQSKHCGFCNYLFDNLFDQSK